MAWKPREEGGRVILSWLIPEATDAAVQQKVINGTGARRELTRAYTYILSHYPSQEDLYIDRCL